MMSHPVIPVGSGNESNSDMAFSNLSADYNFILRTHNVICSLG